jgi:putative ABC transport system permease protein
MTLTEHGLGFRFLTHNPLRLAAAVAGVAVAVVIMFVELGLLLGVLNSQAMVASRIDADLVVMDRARIDLHKWNSVRDIRLYQIAAQPDVADVVPIYQGTMGFRNPPDTAIRRIIVFAFPADDVPFDIGNREKI